MARLHRKNSWALLVSAGVLAWSGTLPRLAAEDAAPAIPHKDFTDTPAHAVIRVVSGDTVIVKAGDQSQRIGLLGAGAAPRSVPAGRDDARQFLENLLSGEEVYVAYAAEEPPADKFGRRPAYLYRAPDGLFVNLELVRQGYAEVPADEKFEHRVLFEHYQQRAQEAKKGRWGSPPPAAAPATQPAAPQAVSRSQEKAPDDAGDDVIVYVTASGKKYHRADCYHLRKSRIPMKLSEVKARGYQPCSHCKPPQ